MDSIATRPKPTCDLCGSEGTVVQDTVADPDRQIPGHWGFRRCANPECGVYWLDPAPLEAELWKAYVTYHTHTRKRTGRTRSALLSLFNRLTKWALFPVWTITGLRQEARYLRFMTLEGEPVGRVLDVGCGAGRLLNRLHRRGWEVEGTDFDPQAAAKAANRYGFKVHVGELGACTLPDASFDAITMSQAIEHLPHPEATLAECLRILKPGGKLVMTTPNVLSVGAQEFGAWWRGWEAPRHLHLFSVGSLARLAQKCGFEVLEARSYSFDAAGIYRVSWSNRVAHEVPFLTKLRLVVWGYRMELREHKLQASAPNTGQNVLVCARKPL